MIFEFDDSRDLSSHSKIRFSWALQEYGITYDTHKDLITFLENSLQETFINVQDTIEEDYENSKDEIKDLKNEIDDLTDKISRLEDENEKLKEIKH